MWLIKRFYPQGHCLYNPTVNKEKIVLWTKEEAKKTARFLNSNNSSCVHSFLLSQGIPYQIWK